MDKFDIKKGKELIVNSFQDKRFQFYYYVTFSLIVIIVFIVFAIYPTLNSIFSELNTINIINTQNQQMSTRYQDINSTYAIYLKKVKSKYNKLKVIFPNNENTGFILGNIYEILNNNNVSLQSISFGSSASLPTSLSFVNLYNNFSVSVSGVGTYQDFLSVLETLSLYPQKILVYNANYVPNTNNSNVLEPQLFFQSGNLSFDALVFYSK